jgi:hypothetical protein
MLAVLVLDEAGLLVKTAATAIERAWIALAKMSRLGVVGGSFFGSCCVGGIIRLSSAVPVES